MFILAAGTRVVGAGAGHLPMMQGPAGEGGPPDGGMSPEETLALEEPRPPPPPRALVRPTRPRAEVSVGHLALASPRS